MFPGSLRSVHSPTPVFEVSFKPADRQTCGFPVFVLWSIVVGRRFAVAASLSSVYVCIFLCDINRLDGRSNGAGLKSPVVRKSGEYPFLYFVISFRSFFSYLILIGDACVFFGGISLRRTPLVSFRVQRHTVVHVLTHGSSTEGAISLIVAPIT